jgi:signal transduction histidine kinase
VTAPDQAPAPATTAPRAWPPRGRFTDELLRPFILLTVIALTSVELTDNPVALPALAVGVFVPVAVITVGGLFWWHRLSQPVSTTVVCGYVVCAAVLFPLAPGTAAPAFAFVATLMAGEQLAVRRWAITVGVVAAVICAAGAWYVGHAHLQPDEWSWWVALSVGLPVSVGIARRDRDNALRNAELATTEAQRAAESEAREAALVERGRIAREIHDVLAHSLSGIALQLEMANALHERGRDDEADSAVRSARALAVDSITETRRAIHALREDTLPLDETLRLMATGESVPFEVLGTPGPTPVATAQAVIRTAQEALTNATRHAPGAARTMVLTFAEHAVALTVTNAVCGTKPDTAGGGGMGLVGMRERAALLGGTLHAGPTGDGGWQVGLEVPR